MAAQTVREVSIGEAQAIVARGKLIGPQTYAIAAQGVTVTVRPGTKPNTVKLIIVQGCAC